jgi:hypothetical protein
VMKHAVPLGELPDGEVWPVQTQETL